MLSFYNHDITETKEEDSEGSREARGKAYKTNKQEEARKRTVTAERGRGS